MTSRLCRQVAVGESLSFDGGRILLELAYRSSQYALFRYALHEDVVIDKGPAVNDPNPERPRLCKAGLFEALSFDQGRIVLNLDSRTGRRATLNLTLQEDVVVDKPRLAANDPPQNI